MSRRQGQTDPARHRLPPRRRGASTAITQTPRCISKSSCFRHQGQSDHWGCGTRAPAALPLHNASRKALPTRRTASGCPIRGAIYSVEHPPLIDQHRQGKAVAEHVFQHEALVDKMRKAGAVFCTKARAASGSVIGRDADHRKGHLPPLSLDNRSSEPISARRGRTSFSPDVDDQGACHESRTVCGTARSGRSSSRRNCAPTAPLRRRSAQHAPRPSARSCRGRPQTAVWICGLPAGVPLRASSRDFSCKSVQCPAPVGPQRANHFSFLRRHRFGQALRVWGATRMTRCGDCRCRQSKKRDRCTMKGTASVSYRSCRASRTNGRPGTAPPSRSPASASRGCRRDAVPPRRLGVAL